MEDENKKFQSLSSLKRNQRGGEELSVHNIGIVQIYRHKTMEMLFIGSRDLLQGAYMKLFFILCYFI
jgi:hypothetical protein